ncbi:hypothetical protein SALB1_0803 [Salinisphaera sp. LB1]|nr:hypothetical protein SALB1_0803 [Salinisphaera sp. LB1]
MADTAATRHLSNRQTATPAELFQSFAVSQLGRNIRQYLLQSFPPDAEDIAVPYINEPHTTLHGKKNCIARCLEIPRVFSEDMGAFVIAVRLRLSRRWAPALTRRDSQRITHAHRDATAAKTFQRVCAADDRTSAADARRWRPSMPALVSAPGAPPVRPRAAKPPNPTCYLSQVRMSFGYA